MDKVIDIAEYHDLITSGNVSALLDVINEIRNGTKYAIDNFAQFHRLLVNDEGNLYLEQ